MPVPAKRLERKKPICPVLCIGAISKVGTQIGPAYQCREKDCSWWIPGDPDRVDSQRCAVAVLAVRLSDLETLASAIEGIERR